MTTNLEGVASYPDPTEADLQSPLFNAIWGVIKDWDISTHKPEDGKRMYTGAMGNHVMAIVLAMPWHKYGDPMPPEGVEVIAFSPEWIDEDFNKEGTRLGFLNGDGVFYSAFWLDYQDTYENSESNPTHWKPKPLAPITIK